ncbi:MAG: M23 family metallopeptidase [Clostridiales bacterium]|nr:M23 family metallopeptidase [Clostridiales bacterium]
MNEEIEYAEMLEIPVSTVNVVQKKHGKRRKRETIFAHEKQNGVPMPDIKDSLIAQMNDKLHESADEKITAEAELFAESANSSGELRFDDVPERIDTFRLYGENERPYFEEAEAFEGGMDEDTPLPYPYEKKNKALGSNKVRRVLGIEFGAVCALCGAIFLTNVFMPNSAINTFFRSLGGGDEVKTDNRTYTEFTLSSVVSEYTDVELSLSETGVLTFQKECCVYPTADGEVLEVMQTGDGVYTVKIGHSDTFTGVIEGLDCVYYEVGDKVKANVPVGYTDGEAQVQVTMYSNGELLNCFQVTEENCLAWITQE